MPLEQNVSEVVRILLARHHQSQRDVARALGRKEPAVSLKLNGHRPWTLQEVAQLAAHFGVPARVFLTDPAELLSPDLAGSIGTGRKRRLGRQRIGGSILALPLPRTAFEQVAA